MTVVEKAIYVVLDMKIVNCNLIIDTLVRIDEGGLSSKTNTVSASITHQADTHDK